MTENVQEDYNGPAIAFMPSIAEPELTDSTSSASLQSSSDGKFLIIL